MNEPIISPWFFYLISVVDGLLCFICVGCAIFFIATAFCGMESTECYDQDEKDKWIKRFKRSFLVSIILAILLVLTPNSQTITKMAIAKQLTPNNIKAIGELTTEVMKNSVDFINDKVIEIVREVKKND